MFVVFPRIDQGVKIIQGTSFGCENIREGKGIFDLVLCQKNHVKSQELLKQNKSQDKEDNGTTIEDDDVECLGNTITLASTSMERGAQPKMVQSTLTRYLEVDEGQPPGPENTLQRIEDDVKKSC